MYRDKPMNDITTTDLSRFGSRERSMLEDLLKAWREQGLPEDFYPEKVKPMMNMLSGNVFLTNEDFQVAMMNGDKLESFYSCPNCGNEGFKEDFEDCCEEANPCCKEYLKDMED